jgi:hypothetical protein
MEHRKSSLKYLKYNVSHTICRSDQARRIAWPNGSHAVASLTKTPLGAASLLICSGMDTDQNGFDSLFQLAGPRH